MTRAKRKIAVIDYETDPFMYGRVPKPFVVEFYSDEITEVFWGDDCSQQLADFLETLKQDYLIYAHNGGKFDFHFLHKWIDNPALIIKNRIVECRLFNHTLRDSYAILPVPLGSYDKAVFDYNKMERHCREENREEILVYLHRDCTSLHSLVSAFIDRFGPRMTIGGTAIREIQKLHPFRKNGSSHDKTFRQFYFGGRVQCFRGGILPGPWKLVDRNSMYPAVMRDELHPINGRFDLYDDLPEGFELPYFAKITARNRNALPSRADDGSLTFSKEYGEFFACSHEIKVALEYGLIDIEKVHYVYVSCDATNFAEFVEKFGAEKEAAKRNKDKTAEIFAKLIMNSGYGRAGLNPENFRDYLIHRDFGIDEDLEIQGYTKSVDYDDFELWSRNPEIKEEDYCDVAIASSITSAARANLLKNIQLADDPIYCDTDSIICRAFGGDMDPYRLGAWDVEKESDTVVIAGKKMYALYNDPKGNALKLSSKGGTLSLAELIKMAEGETVEYLNPAPSFSLRGPPAFTARRFNSTLDRVKALQ